MYHNVYLHTRDYRWATSLAIGANWLSFQLGVGIDFNSAAIFGLQEYSAVIHADIGPFCISLTIYHSPHNRMQEELTPEMLDELIASLQ